MLFLLWHCVLALEETVSKRITNSDFDSDSL